MKVIVIGCCKLCDENFSYVIYETYEGEAKQQVQKAPRDYCNECYNNVDKNHKL